MQVREVEIQNIKGIEYLKFSPGTLTVLAGANGAGKSSVIDAIRMIFDGGSDPGWLRKNAKKGYCKLVLDTGAVIHKHVTGTGSRLEIIDADGNPVAAPQAYVNGLAEALAVDPAKLLDPSLKPKDISKALLDVMPLTFTAEEFESACGDCPAELSLAGMETMRKVVYSRRTKVKSEAETADRTVTGLRRDMGADDPTDWAARAKELTAEKAAGEYDIVAVRDVAKREAEAQIEHVRAVLAAALARIDAEARPELDRISADLVVAGERLQQQSKYKGAAETIERMSAAAREKFREADELTSQLERLDDLKKRKLAELPIDGLTFDGYQFLVDGVPWDHVNLARRTDVALQVAVLRAGPLKWLVLDNAEHLDSEGMELLRAGAERRGLQVLAARVTDAERLVVQV